MGLHVHVCVDVYCTSSLPGDMDLDITLHGFSLPSFLPRVSHVRVPQQGSEDHHSSLVHTMPTSHPLLTRRSDVSQQSNVRVVSGASGVHFEFSAEHHGDNMVAMQQLLNSIGFHGVGGGSAGGEGGGASASRPRGKGGVLIGEGFVPFIVFFRL